MLSFASSGEMAELVEGAPLLREYGAKKFHRGFESLSLRHETRVIGRNMVHKVVRPEDMIADHENEVMVGGMKVRKGTAAAVFANAKILSSVAATPEEKASAKNMIAEYAPGLIAAGMYDLVTWKNPEIQKIFDDIVSKMKK